MSKINLPKKMFLSGGLGGGGVISWLLRDDFTDTRAAGSVDGTPATPGPGTRTVHDIDSDAISVGGGKISFANPNNNWTDQYLTYGRQAVGLGKVYLWSAEFSAKHNAILGLDDTANTYANKHGYYWSVAAVKIYSSPYMTIFTSADDIEFFHAVVQGDNKGYMFHKEGASGKWMLFFPTIASDDPLYLSFFNKDAAFDLRKIRIPDETWLPVPSLYDTFTRSDGAVGSTEATGPDGQALSGIAWVDKDGTFEIDTNKLSMATVGTGDQNEVTVVDSGKSDVLIACAIKCDTYQGIVLRYSDSGPGDFWLMAASPLANLLVLYEHTSETYTARAQTVIAIAEDTTHTIYVRTVGQVIEGWISTTLLTVKYSSAANNETATLHGVRAFDKGDSEFDNFLVWPVGVDGEHNKLNRWIK